MQDLHTVYEDEVQEQRSVPESLFGVCQALGEDLGFDPTYLRLAMLALLFFSPLAMLGAYIALGGFVAASRGLFPDVSVDSSRPVATAIVSAEPSAEDREPERIAA